MRPAPFQVRTPATPRAEPRPGLRPNRAALVGLALVAACGEARTPDPTTGEPGAGDPASQAPHAEAAGDPEPGGVARDPGTPPRFLVRGSDRGLDLRVTSGAVPPTQILEVKGGGVALFDWRADGDWDPFFPNGATLDAPDRGPGARLFDTRPGLRFEDVSAVAGLDLTRWGMGAAAGDLDGDGRDDLLVACYGLDAVLLQGEDGALPEAPGALVGDDAGWSSGVALGDLDRDGDLDAYVARYLRFDPADPPPRTEFLGVEVFGGPFGLEPEPDRLWENRGDGTFTDARAAAGLDALAPAHGLGAVIVDLDDDGRLDVYVGNDSQPDRALFGQGGLRLAERAAAVGLATGGDGRAQATMGIAVGDVNGDRRPDLFTTNFANDTNTLRLSTSGGRWRDGSLAAGVGAVSRPFCGWSTAFADVDLDGACDLLVFDGHVYPESVATRLGSHRAQSALLFRGGDGRFERVTGESALDAPHCDRGAVVADLDGDGDPDAVVVDIAGPVRVLENTTDAPGRAIVVELADSAELGARAVLTDGERSWTRWFASGVGYQSGAARQAVFGLGERKGPFTLELTWPDGERTTVEDLARGARLGVGR